MHVRSFLTGVALLACSAHARAQGDIERATAREAAANGVSAFEAGRYAEAADSFTRAEQLVHAPTHLLYLARAQAKLGKLLAARENYAKVEHEVLAPSAPKAFTDAKAAASEERAAVETRLSYVTITVSGNPTDALEVTLDGAPLPRAIVGMAMPVDPGQHAFRANEPGRTSEVVRIVLSEAAKQTVTLILPASSTPSAAVTNGAAPEVMGATPVDVAPSKHALRSAAYVSFGVGAVGLGLGTFFLLKSATTRNDADGLYRACNAASPTKLCSDPNREAGIDGKDNDADGQRNLGLGALAGGGVGVAAGVVLLVLDAQRSHAQDERSTRVVPVLGARSFGVAGTF